MSEAEENTVILNIEQFFSSGNLSDAIIKCSDDIEFNVHKIVLCAQSKFFLNAFGGEMKEARDGVIPLKDDDASALKAMLRFMYTRNYDDCEGLCSPVIFNTQVYSIADKYDIPALKALAMKKFKVSESLCWKMDSFPNVIAEVYSSTPSSDRGLRQIVIETASDHIIHLLKSQAFEKVLEDVTGFAADITKHVARKRNQPKQPKSKCPNCNEIWTIPEDNRVYFCPHCGRSRGNWIAHKVD